MELTLIRPGADTAEGTVTWDPATGSLSGPLADEVRALAEAARLEGWIVSAPVPTSYTITDPLRDRRQMATILATRWRLPEELGDALGEPDQDESPDIPVVY